MYNIYCFVCYVKNVICLFSAVRVPFIFYSFMLLFGNSLIFQKMFSEDIPHLIHLFSFLS